MKDWPRNFSNTYSGKELLVADALARSINTIAVRVGEKVGVNKIYQFTTQELGITSFVSADRDSGPMILGSSTTGVTPEEMAGAYSIFGSGGSFTTVHSYVRVDFGSGKQLMEPKIETRQVIDTDTRLYHESAARRRDEGGGKPARAIRSMTGWTRSARPAPPATTGITGSSD